MKDSITNTAVLDSRQFVIAVKRLADSLSYGMDHSPFHGPGIEYAESRLYQPGDPVKSIDWRVTARTGRYYVKEYEAPRRLPVYLLVDTSASMTIRSGEQSKYELAVFVAGGHRAGRPGQDEPGGDDERGGTQPARSPEPVARPDHAMAAPAAPVSLRRRNAAGRSIAELTPRLTHRALLIVLSDLHDPEGVTLLKEVGQRHDCVVLQFRDPAEVSVRGSGFMRAREAESGLPFSARPRQAVRSRSALRTSSNGLPSIIFSSRPTGRLCTVCVTFSVPEVCSVGDPVNRLIACYTVILRCVTAVSANNVRLRIERPCVKQRLHQWQLS